jgi:hypothetical protein
MVFNRQTGLRYDGALHISLNYANVISGEPAGIRLLYSAIRKRIADGRKMAAAEQEHNRNIEFSTTLPINVRTPHKQAVQVRRDKVYTSLPMNTGGTKKRKPGLRREVLRVRSRIVL